MSCIYISLPTITKTGQESIKRAKFFLAYLI